MPLRRTSRGAWFRLSPDAPHLKGEKRGVQRREAKAEAEGGGMSPTEGLTQAAHTQAARTQLISIVVELPLLTPGGEAISPDSEEGGVNYS